MTLGLVPKDPGKAEIMTWNRNQGRKRPGRFSSAIATAPAPMPGPLPTIVREPPEIVGTLMATPQRRAGRSAVLDVRADDGEVPIIATILGAMQFSQALERVGVQTC